MALSLNENEIENKMILSVTVMVNTRNMDYVITVDILLT